MQTYLKSTPKSSGWNVLSSTEMFRPDSTTPSSSSIKFTISAENGNSEPLSIFSAQYQNRQETRMNKFKVNFMPKQSKVDKTHTLNIRMHWVVEMVSTLWQLSLTPEHSQFFSYSLNFGGWQEHSRLTSQMLSCRPPKSRDHEKNLSILTVVTNCQSQCANPVIRVRSAQPWSQEQTLGGSKFPPFLTKMGKCL